jgi:hypothetical protein
MRDTRYKPAVLNIFDSRAGKTAAGFLRAGAPAVLFCPVYLKKGTANCICG